MDKFIYVHPYLVKYEYKYWTEGLGHGITTITQAYKLLPEGRTLVEISIELGILQKEASKFSKEFLKIKFDNIDCINYKVRTLF